MKRRSFVELEPDVSDPDVGDDQTAADDVSKTADGSKSVAPVAQLAEHQLVLLLRDYAGRLSGSEGRAVISEVQSVPGIESKNLTTAEKAVARADKADAMPTAKLYGSERTVPISFDSVSHVLLPWPVPVDNAIQKFSSSKMTQAQLASEMRSVMTPGLGRYAGGQELIALVDGIWIDALVVAPPEDATSTVHKIQGGGSQQSLLLHPWNHAPQIMRCSIFNDLWTRHTAPLIAEHSFITDALSGQKLNVHHQCVPLDLEPAVAEGESGASISVADVGELFSWIVTAQAARRDVPSTLAKAARLVSNGPPDEASLRVIKELADRQLSMTGSKRFGYEVLQRAQGEVEMTKDSYVSALDRMNYQHKIDMDEHLAEDARRESTIKSEQKAAQEELAKKKSMERTNLIEAQKGEAKESKNRHEQLMSDQRQRELSVKRQHEQESDKELKAFKEGQFKEADAFKRKAASRRIEEDKNLSLQSRKELEEFQDSRKRKIEELEAKHDEQKGNMAQDLAKDSELRQQQFNDRKEALDAAHAAQKEQTIVDQQEDLEAFDSAQTSALQKLEQDFEEQTASQIADHENQIVQDGANKEQGVLDLQAVQVEEKKQLGWRHKDELKKFNLQAETRRTALATKQDEERKAVFASRRNNNSGEKTKEELEEDKNKISPQKERDQLEAQIAKDKQSLVARQEEDVVKLQAKQAEKFEQYQQMLLERTEKMIARHVVELRELKEDQAEHTKRIKDQQAEARVRLLARHEKDKEEQTRSFAKEQDALNRERVADHENLQSRKEEFKKAMVARQAKEKEELLVRIEEAKKGLDTRIEDRRKFHAMALEEELNAFTQKQDEERSVLVTKQKADEKALVESLTAEGTQLRETITEEEADLIARHKNAMSEMESSHVQQQANLDARHSAARQQLQMDLQKRKTNLLADQQASRDQLASDYRMKLSKVIEHAQNELNQALLGKACVLLTGAPAAGKTCLISQLMMNALNDKQSSFVPIAIKVQQLQRALLQDCAELNSLQSSIQSEREQLDSKQRGERDAAQFDQLQAVEKRLKEERDRLAQGHGHQLQEVYRKSTFANAWNWVDAYLRELHGESSEVYLLQRQALISRRALILLDGIDEGGAKRDEIERHIVQVLAKQGHAMVVTSRLDGLNVQLFQEQFEHLKLKPLTDAQQQQLIERRLASERGRAEDLLGYLRTRVPLDTETGMRMTGNPLMLSMIISLFESMDGSAMPDTLSELYTQASEAMLSRIDSGDGKESGAASSVPHLTSLLEAIFFRAHSAKRRLIEEQHVDAAALELGAPDELASIDWPTYRGRIRVGQVVKLVRGEHAGEDGVLSSDARGSLINGKEPKNPFKITFDDQSTSGWVRESDFESSGLERQAFDSKYGAEGRKMAMRVAVEKLPDALRNAVRAVRSRVAHEQLPLLTMLQAEPLLMQSSHLSFQEFYCARAIRKGMSLPGEPPWKWSAWWANCLRLGVELGDGFGVGLMQAAGAKGSLNLAGQVGGHRPTSLSAVAELMQGLHTLDLSMNNIGADEMPALAKAIASSNSLTSLSLAKNMIGDDGAKAVAAILGKSKLSMLNLFNTGIREEACEDFVQAIKDAPNLKKLNLQYNALRAESKKALELANATREVPIFLVT